MLYRGVSLRIYAETDGRILPKGSKILVVPLCDGSFRVDGTMTVGYTERNAARAQQINSGHWGNCFISTSRSFEVAHHFATSGHASDGFVYSIDESLFSEFGVVAVEFADPLYPGEMETSIRSKDGGEIPPDVIAGLTRVTPSRANTSPSLT